MFADAKFDTWVLNTIRAHILTNFDALQISERKLVPQNGKPLMVLPPLSLFQNTSCEPNTYERYDGNGSTATFIARRDMKAGEEMMPLYIDHINGYTMSRKERQALLMPWIAGPCACERCVREETLESEVPNSSLDGRPESL